MIKLIVYRSGSKVKNIAVAGCPDGSHRTVKEIHELIKETAEDFVFVDHKTGQDITYERLLFVINQLEKEKCKLPTT